MASELSVNVVANSPLLRFVRIATRRREAIPVTTVVLILIVTAGCNSGPGCYGGCACSNKAAQKVGHTAPPSDNILTATPPAVPIPRTTPPPVGESVYGHAENYEWLIGRLQHIHVPRESWKIRYSPLDQQDRWGGSMVLAPDIRLENFADGDIVYVRGDILGSRASLYVTGPRYRVRTIRRVNESDRNRVASDRARRDVHY